ncbi:hypothetical protein BDR26DRAFT_490506 [Obelidium mucronatum]|nr:hypothetical protein BDR26DRAFT_490506 [Obelidium mucronatum]
MCVLALLVLLATAHDALAFDWTLLGAGNGFTAFTTTLRVPPVPARPATGDATYFYWPGLQTNAAARNYSPIGFGVLQPVLTFGPACTPNQPRGASVYRGWHVSAQYVNPGGKVATHSGCLGGNMMDAAPGDALLMAMVLQGSTWVQTVTRLGVACSGPGSGVDTSAGCQVSFAIDMLGQGQNRAELVLELYYQAVVTHDVSFTDISMTILNPEPSNSTRFCTPTSRLQKTETCSGMVLSADKKTCTIQECLFTAPAVVVVPPPVSAGSGTDANGTPISPGNVLPPPPPEDETSDPVDPSNSGSSSSPGSGSSSSGSNGSTSNGSNAISGPNNAVVLNQTSTSSGPSKTLIYAGAGVGAALVVAIGAFVLIRRNSKAKRDSIESSIDLKHQQVSSSNSRSRAKESIDISMTGRSPKAAYLESSVSRGAPSPKLMRSDSRASGDNGRRTPGGSATNRAQTPEVRSGNSRRPSASERYTPSGNSRRVVPAATVITDDSNEDTDTDVHHQSSNSSRRQHQIPSSSSNSRRQQRSERNRNSIFTDDEHNDDSNNDDTDLDDERVAPPSPAISSHNSRRARPSDVSSSHSRRHRTENSRDRSVTGSANGSRRQHHQHQQRTDFHESSELTSSHRGRSRGADSPVNSSSSRHGRDRSASRG